MNSGLNAKTANSDEWTTPDKFFDQLDAEFGFTIDVAATKENAKVGRYFTQEEDGLKQNWGGHRVWCNPPYSGIVDWVNKAHDEAKDALIVMLLPVRTDTDWFHSLLNAGVEIRWLRKRVKFEFEGKVAGSPRFASLLAIWRPFGGGWSAT